ncbi:hypothetical protein BD324DRAFT_613564 [Kockovaella imperatae]|uniref:Outer spore wall protein RRT8 n=1 Tax=Kockovaella imperatae TaxID=4999 RepID=A0A1Y1UT46_9TREE|nr:hypothetical protein BD324DRAFT_613564 [Kockovaella imperatae]ORX41188.1 hypothetical protein BD324DRAFT_613564 [Kockovaella imperatae]
MASETRRRSGRLEAQKDAFAESAKRQVSDAGGVASEAVTSGAWAYPILGVFYLVSHPKVVKPIMPALVRGTIMSLMTIGALFTFTYLPQVAVLAFVSGPLAFVAAIPLVLGESYVVINFLLRAFIFGQLGEDLFDMVLVQKGQSALVERGRQVTSKGGKTMQLGKMITKPLSRFSTDNIVRYVLTLPLNFIPVVGTAFFLAFNGYKSGPGYHARYFQLKGYDRERRQAAINKRRGSYTAFGVVAMLLNLVPVASIFFNFTSTVGAAIWAANIENKQEVNPVQEVASAAKDGSAKDAVDATMSKDSKKEL